MISACKKNVDAANPSDPAQCIAAFNWGRNLELRAPPNLHRAIGLAGREAYEILKLKASGHEDGGQSEATTFTKEHYNDHHLMERLIDQCLIAQDNNPDFQKANNTGQIMDLGRRFDPLCKGRSGCAGV